VSLILITDVLDLETWNRPGRYATCQPGVVEGTGDVGISSDSIARGHCLLWNQTDWDGALVVFAGDGILGAACPAKLIALCETTFSVFSWGRTWSFYLNWAARRMVVPGCRLPGKRRFCLCSLVLEISTAGLGTRESGIFLGHD